MCNVCVTCTATTQRNVCVTAATRCAGEPVTVRYTCASCIRRTYVTRMPHLRTFTHPSRRASVTFTPPTRTRPRSTHVYLNGLYDVTRHPRRRAVTALRHVPHTRFQLGRHRDFNGSLSAISFERRRTASSRRELRRCKFCLVPAGMTPSSRRYYEAIVAKCAACYGHVTPMYLPCNGHVTDM